MTAILSLIYCWLQDFWFSLTEFGVNTYDSLLTVADGALAGLGSAGFTFPTIPDEYAWILGALGLSQAFAIMGTAMLVRFGLQAIPFVRWGS